MHAARAVFPTSCDCTVQYWSLRQCSVVREPARPALNFAAPYAFVGALHPVIMASQMSVRAGRSQVAMRSGARKAFRPARKMNHAIYIYIYVALPH